MSATKPMFSNADNIARTQKKKINIDCKVRTTTHYYLIQQLCFLKNLEKEVEIRRLESCGSCNVSEAKLGTKSSKCSTCGCQDQVVSSRRTPLGIFQQSMTCSSCNGTGKTLTPCNTCSTEGRVRKTKEDNISIKVPASVDSGSRLRVRNECKCNAGRRGASSKERNRNVNPRETGLQIRQVPE